MIVPERIMRGGKACPAFQIDDDLAPIILRLKWHTDKDGYVRAVKTIGGKTKHFALHRLVFRLKHGYWPKQEIDHINRDKLDNRAANLREVNNQENTDNGGGRPRLEASNHLPKFVYFEPKSRKYRPYVVRIRINSKFTYLGSFATPEEASIAIDQFKERSGLCQ